MAKPQIGYEIWDTVPNCCGVYDLGQFYHLEDTDNWHYGNTIKEIPVEGTGYFIATFVEGDETQQKAKEFLKNKHVCLFESKPRINHGEYAGLDKNGEKNKVVLCVFLHKQAE